MKAVVKRVFASWVIVSLMIAAFPVIPEIVENAGIADIPSVPGTYEVYGAEAQRTATNVDRIDGANRYQTSFQIANALKKELGVEKFDSIILARGSNYPDALSGSSLAAVVKAPIILVHEGMVTETVSYINNNLNPGGTVYILGGALAVSDRFAEGLDPVQGFQVTRLGGANRYETNLLILREVDRVYAEQHMGELNNKLIVCTGQSYADSLSAGALGLPMLLAGDMFTVDQMVYMSERGNIDITIIGGTKALGSNIEIDCSKYGTVSRVYGSYRYETAVQIAKRFFGSKPSKILLVYGDNYPDGICAGPLAYAMKCPILLTSGKSNIATAYNFQVSAGRPKTTIIGGTSIVSTKLAAASKLFTTGWNAFGNGYVYVNSNGLMVTSKFTEAGYTITPTAGGIISKDSRAEVRRRQDVSSYGTAIVIDISDQTLDYVEGGVIMLTTNIVTGNRGTNDTPTGTYYVLGKQYDPNGKIPLVGDDYTSYVTYWMPFIGNAYGIHDATWRSSFGGSIYTWNGSHGCVNVPKASMARLFNMVSVWTRVVIKR